MRLLLAKSHSRSVQWPAFHVSSSLKTNASCFFRQCVPICQKTWHHIPQDFSLYIQPSPHSQISQIRLRYGRPTRSHLFVTSQFLELNTELVTLKRSAYVSHLAGSTWNMFRYGTYMYTYWHSASAQNSGILVYCVLKTWLTNHTTLLIKRKLKYLATFEVPTAAWLRMKVFWVTG